MNIKIRLRFSDCWKLMIGCRVLVLDPINSSIITIQSGKDTYVCKG